MKLKSLHIEDYKVFKDFDIDLLGSDGEALPIIVLAGVNGSGKTTLLEFINNFNKLEYNNKSKLVVVDKQSYILGDYILSTQTNLSLKKAISEAKFYQENHLALNEMKMTALPAHYDIKSYITYFNSGIDDTKKVADEFVKTFYDFLKNHDYRPSEVKGHFHNYMQEIFDDLDLTFKYSHLDKEDNVWFTNNNGAKFLIDKLSTGEKTLLSKVLYLYFKDYKEKIILIDEPELSLHPSWQNKVLKIYENFAKLNSCQIIIATHSPHIIGSAKNEYLRFLVKEDNKIVAKKLNGSPLDRDTNTLIKTLMGAEYIPIELQALRRDYKILFDKEEENTKEAKALEKEILKWESPNSSFWQGLAFDKELRGM